MSVPPESDVERELRWRQEYIDEIAELVAERDRYRQALTELVRLKDLKEAAKIEEGTPPGRHPLITWTVQEKAAAWDFARSVLATQEEESDGP